MLVNARFLSQRTTGVQRFAREIVRESLESGLWKERLVQLVAPRSSQIPDAFAGFPVTMLGQRAGHPWEQIDLAKAARNDSLTNLCSTAPMFTRNQIVVLHDAAVVACPQNFTFAFRNYYRGMISLYSRFSRVIGTVSKFSAQELVKHFGISPNKIEVIPESGEHILSVPADFEINERYGLVQDEYFLAVSSHASTKNFDAVVRSVHALQPLAKKFVVVGGRNARIFSKPAAQVRGAIDVGYVTDAQLRGLYEHAACFVYPSLYEGFGIPPLEAMNCGCPVLVARSTSLPEVCADAAAYCDPYDHLDIARQLSRILESRSAREDMREAGLLRAKTWTWHAAARRLAEIQMLISH